MTMKVTLDEFVGEKDYEAVNHPPHYMSYAGIESIDVIDAFTDHLVGREANYTSNILKYVMRWKNKGGLKDLKKARWYLDRLINYIETIEKENE